MIRKHTEFPLPLDPPGKLDKQAIHCPTDIFGPLSRGQRHWSDVNHCVWYLFDLKVTRSLGLSHDPSDSECSALTYFSMSLAYKYVNLKELYNQDSKNRSTLWSFQKRRRTLHEIPNPRDKLYKRCFSNSIPYMWF